MSYVTPVPVDEYIAPVSAVHVVPAPVVEYIAQAPAVFSPEPADEYITPAPTVDAARVVLCIASAPAVYAVPTPIVEYFDPMPTVYPEPAPVASGSDAIGRPMLGLGSLSAWDIGLEILCVQSLDVLALGMGNR